MSALLADALAYHERGISFVPVADKRPTVKWKPFAKCPPTVDQAREWFTQSKVNGVAVIAGPVSSNLAIRDFDTVSGYDAWAHANPALAKVLPTVKTGRGLHVWFQSDCPRIIKLADGEFRGAGISLAPHSRHRSGKVYEWIVPLCAGALPMVEYQIFTGGNVTEKSEAISEVSADSALSAFSAISATDPDSMIQSTLPRKQGERNSCLLKLARGLKFNLGLANAPKSQLKIIVQRWHEMALPVIGTKDFDDTWADFLHAFRRAKVPMGLDVVDAVAGSVDPCDLPAVAANYDGMPTKMLIGLCYALAKRNRGRFFLSTHDAAPRLNISPTEVWRKFRMLEDDGVIQVVKRGNTHDATRYRWIASPAEPEGMNDGR